MKKQIIAIGGGGFSLKSGEPSFEKYIVQQSAKDQSKVCFLPQASNENRDYITRFYQAFLAVGAQPSWLSLFGRVEPGWQEHLLQQDIIFVGGGNTCSMLALWAAWGVDTVLRQAYDQGIVLADSSAGAICWFQQGITDSVWPLGVLPGLGILPGSCCPHYDDEPERKPTYLRLTQGGQVAPGIALESAAAAHYIDGKLSYIVAKPLKKAYHIASGVQHEVSVKYRLY
jgi:peptidase E